MKASELKAGDKVMYHDIPATVLHVRANGVTVTYWATKGPRAGEEVKERVSAAYLTRAA
jgi:hypothetical protein